MNGLDITLIAFWVIAAVTFVGGFTYFAIMEGPDWLDE